MHVQVYVGPVYLIIGDIKSYHEYIANLSCSA